MLYSVQIKETTMGLPPDYSPQLKSNIPIDSGFKYTPREDLVGFELKSEALKAIDQAVARVALLQEQPDRPTWRNAPVAQSVSNLETPALNVD